MVVTGKAHPASKIGALPFGFAKWDFAVSTWNRATDGVAGIRTDLRRGTYCGAEASPHSKSTCCPYRVQLVRGNSVTVAWPDWTRKEHFSGSERLASPASMPLLPGAPAVALWFVNS